MQKELTIDLIVETIQEARNKAQPVVSGLINSDIKEIKAYHAGLDWFWKLLNDKLTDKPPF